MPSSNEHIFIDFFIKAAFDHLVCHLPIFLIVIDLIAKLIAVDDEDIALQGQGDKIL